MCTYQFEYVSFLSSSSPRGRPHPSSRVLVSGGCGHRTQSRLLRHVTMKVTHSREREGGREREGEGGREREGEGGRERGRGREGEGGREGGISQIYYEQYMYSEQTFHIQWNLR